MWFDIVKLDLSLLSPQLQAPFQGHGKNINIKVDDKCKKKLINFTNRMIRMGNRNKGVYVDTSETKDIGLIPENMACKVVEEIDAFFNSMQLSNSIEDVDYEKEFDGLHIYVMYLTHGIERLLLLYGKTLDKPLYWCKMIIPETDYLLFNAVKKHWEAS